MPRRPPPVLTFALDDGTPVALRPIMPADRARIRTAFDELSEDSRTLRFLAPVAQLSERQLRYFTEVDHVDHVAWGALDLRDPAEPGYGVGRFIRLAENPEVAEFSLTVVDRAQGHGLGALLLAVLYVVAGTLGVRVLRGVVARANGRMVHWLPLLDARLVEDAEELTFDLPTDGPLPDNPTAHHFADLLGRVRGAAVEQALPTNPWRAGLLGG